MVKTAASHAVNIGSNPVRVTKQVNKFVLIAMRVHLFPSRTQKLSSCAPTILGGRLPGKIGNANIFYPTTKVVGIFNAGIGRGGPVHLFPVAVFAQVTEAREPYVAEMFSSDGEYIKGDTS